MQLGVGGACGDFWDRNKCDGNDDGRLLVTDFWDNVCAAARGLRRDKGAPPAGGSEAAYHQTACNYYGACADGVADYADEVMARAELYGFVGGTTTDPAGLPVADEAAGTGCTGVAVAAGNGEFILDPGANRPGTELAPELVRVRPPDGGVPAAPADHHDGDQPQPDNHEWQAIGSLDAATPRTSAHFVTDSPQAVVATATRSRGQRFSPPANQSRPREPTPEGRALHDPAHGLRVQIIWKTFEGGDHYDHVHVGVKRYP